MAADYPGLLLLSRNEALRAYIDLVLSERGLPLRYFDSAREGLFWLLDHTPRYILLDEELDVDPFAAAARIKHVKRLKAIPLAVLIAPSEKLRTTAEVVRVVPLEKPLTREKLFRFLGMGGELG
ncbi:response regulator [Thermus thermamylovorans]|uniref:Response regulator n=1 Tax=Thermus thermamylovorans TaxID=2509362 RepID=A0A4Q9B7F3_9DEIN|nr:response regulator [Thermus thermamylovorans]TBH21742.1 response regulator [Thermus thermamylovorans]